MIKDNKAPRSKWQLEEKRCLDQRDTIADVLKSGALALNQRQPLQRTVQSKIINQRVVSRLYPLKISNNTSSEQVVAVTGGLSGLRTTRREPLL